MPDLISRLFKKAVGLAGGVWGAAFGPSETGPGAHLRTRPPLERLADISRRLGPSAMVPAGGDREWSRAREDLLDFCEANPDLRKLLNQFGVKRKQLSDLFNVLVNAGAGQVAGGHLVAASAIATPRTLQFLLTRNLKSFDAASDAAYQLIQYFEKGVPLPLR